jgi:hypothetical protein
VHVSDICQAIAQVLAAPRDVVHGQVLNVGDRDANVRIRDVAEIVAGVFSECAVTVGGAGADQRSYRVSFAKIHELLPGFACERTIERGAQELHDLFAASGLTQEDFLSPRFTRLKRIEELLRRGELDESFFWAEAREATTRDHA